MTSYHLLVATKRDGDVKTPPPRRRRLFSSCYAVPSSCTLMLCIVWRVH